MFIAGWFSETRPFMHLSKLIFDRQSFQKYLRYEAHLFSKYLKFNIHSKNAIPI